MFTAIYDYYYGINPGTDLSGGSFTVPYIPAATVTSTISDTRDGDNDGTLAIGHRVQWTEITNDEVILYGVTTEGYPILENTVTGGRFMVTPVNGLHNQTFTINTTDPYTFCFAAGTSIATPTGERAVEDLAMGDLVLTKDGRAVPVLWLGQQRLHKHFGRSAAQMVRIRAGALGNGLPHSDLTVTPDHGIEIDGLLINASALVNGDSVDWVPFDELQESYTIYHIETQDHDVILANGAATETFIDVAGRKGFDNYEEYLSLYGAERIIPEIKAPRISSARLVPDRLKQRLQFKNVAFSNCA